MVIVLAVSVVFYLTPDQPQIPLHARIVCAEAKTAPNGAPMSGWRVAVAKTGEHSEFWEWSAWIQETNREPNRSYSSAPLMKDVLDFQETPELPNEHGILMGGGLGVIDTGKVYRVIGAHNEPGALNKLPQWAALRIPPRLLQLIPGAKPRFATSEWFEIKIPDPERSQASSQLSQ